MNNKLSSSTCCLALFLLCCEEKISREDQTKELIAPQLVTFGASPPRVEKDMDTRITWTWTYSNSPIPAPTCAIDQGIGVLASGATTTTNLSIDTVFHLTCENQAGRSTRDITVFITGAEAPTPIDFIATPSVVPVEVPVEVTWTWSYASALDPVPTCTIDQGVGSVLLGSTSSITLTEDTTFTLTCVSSAGAGTAMTDVIASSWIGAVRAMAPNSWLVWPDSDFHTNAGSIQITEGARGNFNSIINAWCGGVLCDFTQRHYVWGGGHSDGSNNAWFYFDLKSGEWKLFKDRDHSNEIDTGGNPEQDKRYPNGNPVARHTRGSLTHDPDKGTIYIGPAGSVWPGGHSDNGLYSLTIDGSYSLIAEDFTGGNLWGAGLGAVTIFHDKKLYVLSVDGSGYRRLIEWDAAGSGPIEHGRNQSMFNSGSELVGEVDPDTHLLVFRGRGTESLGDFTVYDLKEVPVPLATAYHPTMSGDGELNMTPDAGMSYSTLKQRWYLWAGGAAVYEATVSVTSAEITKLTPSGESPAAISSAAIYGNWRYWPSEDRFFGINGARNNVVIYRPPL